MSNFDDTMVPPTAPMEEEAKPEGEMPAEEASTEAPTEEQAPQA